MFTVTKQSKGYDSPGMFVISAKANTPSGVTVTLTNTVQHNALVALVFSRYGIYAFEVDCDANKNFSNLKKNTLVGNTDAHTVAISSSKTEITIKTGAWEKCVMLLTAQSGMIHYSFS